MQLLLVTEPRTRGTRRIILKKLRDLSPQADLNEEVAAPD
jgi:hypothetical protein